MIGTAELHARFLACTGVCTDTRRIVPGSLFMALKGPRFDANAFAAQALEAGARLAVVDDPAVAVTDRHLLVPDVLTALQDLARHHRRTFHGPVIAITGTNGKTTTKELMAAVMGAQAPVLATAGNLNNEIGVPLTLLGLHAGHRYAIIEMGAGKPGDIDVLCRIAEPDHGLITNVGRAHLQG
ncbi:MAG: Mur ligase family protein, partial [Flavobacteriales bacterium]|nr:Mur ligase family protein [Flavobacteriales bacterium]